MKCGEKALNISSKESTLVPCPCLDRHIAHNKLLLTIWKGQKSKEWQNLRQSWYSWHTHYQVVPMSRNSKDQAKPSQDANQEWQECSQCTT